MLSFQLTADLKPRPAWIASRQQKPHLVAVGVSIGAQARDLLQRRDELVQISRDSPAVRLASLLMVLADANRHGGGATITIAETVNCSYIAELLNVGIDDFADLLLTFQAAGLVKALPDGQLQVIDLDALAHVADAPGQTTIVSTADIGLGGWTMRPPMRGPRYCSPSRCSAYADGAPASINRSRLAFILFASAYQLLSWPRWGSPAPDIT